MSIGVLEGGEEPPREWGPDKGVHEFLVAEHLRPEVRRPPMTQEEFSRTIPYGRAVMNLSAGHYYN